MKKKEKAHGVIIRTNGGPEDVIFSGSIITLKELQDSVEGYIEFVWLRDGKILVVNEDGKINGLDPNPFATSVIQSQGIDDYIVGNALLIDSKYVD